MSAALSPCPAHPVGHYFVHFAMPPSFKRGVTVCIDCGVHRKDACDALAEQVS